MVVLRYVLCFFLFPIFLSAGQFVASIDKNPVSVGESFHLQLTLKDVSAQGMPSLGSLKNIFSIHGQHQSSNTMIINGQVSSSITWQLTLLAQTEGDFEIPSISIQTSEGLLSTEPIKIQVSKGSSLSSSSTDLDGVDLVAEISNATPYKNEPFLYTVRLFARKNLANIQMQKIQVDDAIVEAAGDPRVYDKVENGVRFDVVEFNYWITPLKVGSLRIPTAVVQGGIPVKVKRGSIFDQDFDPFGMIQGFHQLKPFALQTEEIVLDIHPPIFDTPFWIPAKSFKVEDSLEGGSSFQEGEPFTRTFKIIAEGVQSSQLPCLEDFFSGSGFKVYADKPECSDEVNASGIRSTRKETYTFIPQKSGTMILPQISIPWWDTLKKEKKYATIAAKTLEVKPSASKKNLSSFIEEEKESLKIEGKDSASVKRDPILYIVIIGLFFLLVFALAFTWRLQKKIQRLTSNLDQAKVIEKNKFIERLKKKNLRQKKQKKEKKEKLPDLNPT